MIKDKNAFEPLIYAVKDSANKFNFYNKKLLVAVSGGADSVALLFSLVTIQDEFEFDIFAVHIDHGIRGASSQRDAEFVSNLCKKLDVPLYTHRVSGLLELNGSLENNARKVRYKAFAKVAKYYNVDYLILAHHAIDQVETIFMNMFRGCGVDGIVGMKFISDFENIRIIRPFLEIKKADILKALNANSINFCTDESNFSDEYRRNAIRLNVLPTLENIYPNFISSLLKLSRLANTDSQYFENIVEKIMNKYAIISDKYCIIALYAFYKQDRAIIQRIIRAMYFKARKLLLNSDYLDNSEHGLSYKAINEICNSIINGERNIYKLNGNIYVAIDYEYLHFYIDKCHLKPYDSVPFNSKCGKISFDGIDIIKNDSYTKSDGIYIQAIPNELLINVKIRYRNSGDRIRPFGSSGYQSLKKYFINKKIDKQFRNRIPLLTYDSEVLWVIGVGASDLVNIKNENYTILKVKNDLPWARKEQ